MPILVQVVSGTLLRQSLLEGSRHRAVLATQAVAPPSAGLHNIFQAMSDHFLPQMSNEVFRATVPKADSPFPVHDVNPQRQVFQHMPEQLRILDKVREHDRDTPPSGSIGS